MAAKGPRSKRWLDGKSAIITGASQGIGRALVRRLAAEGCRLVLVARSEPEITELAREAEQKLRSPGAVAVPGDVTDPATAQRAVATAIDRFGQLDVLVNNAGLGLRAPVARLDPADLEYVFRVNVIGALNFTRAALPHLGTAATPGPRATGTSESGSGPAGSTRSAGLVVNIASIAALQPVPYLGGYAATKAAVAALSEALRMETAGTGVRVLAVFPGSVETSFKANTRGEPYPERKGASRLSPETVADHIVVAIETGRREVRILSRSERLGLALGRVLPGVVERQLIRRYGDRPSAGADPGPRA